MLPYRALFGLGPLVCLSLANSAQAATSAGCGVQGKPTGAIKLQARDGRGTVREYEVLIPASYTPSTPLALTFVYHEAGGTSASAKAIGLQSAPGAAAASIFVFPQGVPYQSAGVGWNDSCTGYDMPFFDNMLATLEASYCIDQQRVFAGGFSWGCDHVTSLACCRGDRLRAIAAASCSDDFSEPARYQSYLNPTCAAPTPPAVRFTHALSDDNAYPSPLFATTSALFRSWNGCSTSSTATPPSPCRAFDGCRSPLIECAYPGLGHALSSGFSAETWSFFSSLPTTSTPTRVATIPAATSGAHVALGFLLLGAGWLGLRLSAAAGARVTSKPGAHADKKVPGERPKPARPQ